MKYATLLFISIGAFFISSCSLFATGQQTSSPGASDAALSVPVGKNWQLIEEAPQLSGERLPFQTEQSLQPKGARPVAPDKIEVETPH